MVIHTFQRVTDYFFDNRMNKKAIAQVETFKLLRRMLLVQKVFYL